MFQNPRRKTLQMGPSHHSQHFLHYKSLLFAHFFQMGRKMFFQPPLLHLPWFAFHQAFCLFCLFWVKRHFEQHWKISFFGCFSCHQKQRICTGGTKIRSLPEIQDDIVPNVTSFLLIPVASCLKTLNLWKLVAHTEMLNYCGKKAWSLSYPGDKYSAIIVHSTGSQEGYEVGGSTFEKSITSFVQGWGVIQIMCVPPSIGVPQVVRRKSINSFITFQQKINSYFFQLPLWQAYSDTNLFK